MQKYLVTWEYVENPNLGGERVPRLLQGAVIPSLGILAELEKKGTVLGGGVAIGARHSAVIMQASSNEELSRILQSLPFWSLMTFDITPLQSFADRAEQESQSAKILEDLHKRGMLAF